jgi:TetR/AcrR family transcriptional regulator, transcriptional repressor for nem operon
MDRSVNIFLALFLGIRHNTSVARPRQFDEEKIITAVRDLFWRQGYAATSLDDLMQVTGLGKGSIYGAFGDKRNLFLAVLRVYADERVVQAREALTSDKPAIERLRDLFPIRQKRKPSPASCPGCFLFNSTTELALHDPEVRKISTRVYAAIGQLLIETAEQAKKDGDLPREVDASELGRLLLAVCLGLTFLEKTGIDSRNLLSITEGALRLLLGENLDQTANASEAKKQSRAIRKQPARPARFLRRSGNSA